MDKNEGRKKIGIRALLLNEADDERWTAGVAESTQATWLQWLPWIRCAGKHLGSCEIIGVETSGRLIGGVAGLVTEVNGKRKFRSIYLTAYHGLWIRDLKLRPSHIESLTRTVAEALVPFMNERYEQWSFSSAPELLDVRPFHHLNCGIDIYYTYRLPIAEPDAMMASFEKDVRRVIRRSMEAGLKFEEAELSDENIAHHCAFVQSVADREQWGGGPSSPEMFADLLRVCVEGGKASFFMVRNSQGESVGSLILTWDDHRSYAFLGASQGGEAGVMRFMQWSAFNWAFERGFKEMDLLGANLPGLQRFKREWNPDIVSYFSISGGNSGVESRGSHLRKAAKHLVRAIVGGK